MKYISPGYKKTAFTCPHCGVYSSMHWRKSMEIQGASSSRQTYIDNGLHTALCTHCKDRTIWFEGESIGTMLWPFGVANAQMPHDEMPKDVEADYLEARSISNFSPRGAAALLRLAIQKLCVHLGQKGKNINDDIANLVKDGLPVQIQQALDVVRVTGNNAVHPGEMDLNDNPEIVTSLFGLVNMIVDNRIVEPMRIQNLFESLPNGARESIKKRDG